MNNKLGQRMNLFKSEYNRILLKIENDKLKLKEFEAVNDERMIELYKRRINSSFQTLMYFKSHIDYMRLPEEDDECNRYDIYQNFPTKVDSLIPDGEPYVFHGVSNIGIINEIIRTGGLFTPEQRNVPIKSFAAQIDVTYKTNITVSCEFADPGTNSFMPYGAIFVFIPLNSEIDSVINTGQSTEVYGGVSGVDFAKEADRLVAIITTSESKTYIQKWCKEYNWDFNKVFTHDEFLEFCKDKFIKKVI
jgi:hypothetical protein